MRVYSKASAGLLHPYVVQLGNLVVEKQGQNRAKRKVMVCAHMDEVGFVINHITKDGYLGFLAVGGIDDKVLLAKQVQVGPRRIPGVIGARAVHQLKGEEKEKAAKIDTLLIDIGAQSEQEAREYVQEGDNAYFIPNYEEHGEMVFSKALDDRAGCAILLELLQEPALYDFTAVFSVQEEVGLRGAKTAAFGVKPDMAIVIDSTTAADIAGEEAPHAICQVGKGPVVPFMDKGSIYDRKLFQLLFAIANDNHLPIQTKTGVYGANDSAAIQTSGCGCRVISASLPCRYLHSPVAVIAKEDYQNTKTLVRLALKG